jgi:CRISPR/Cas system endoribonuclease Cas6 (RAMP superfamily)
MTEVNLVDFSIKVKVGDTVKLKNGCWYFKVLELLDNNKVLLQTVYKNTREPTKSKPFKTNLDKIEVII